MSRFISPITNIKQNSTLNFFRSGTNTVLITYKDQFEKIENVIDVRADSRVNFPNLFFSFSAKVLFFDEFDQQYAARDPVGGEKELGSFVLWDIVVDYDKNNIAVGSNGKFYISLSNGNIGNNPTTDETQWKEWPPITRWNTNVTYIIGEVVQSSLGNLWKALTAAAGNDPEADNGTNWIPAIDGSKIAEITALEALNSWDIPKTADFTAVASESRQIDAASNTIDVTLPTLVLGDSFIYHNLITSTFKVQILNPIETIKGKSGDITAGTNMELEPGQSVQMIAKSTTILSIVGALV